MSERSTHGQIVILNGVPRSGKSSIARVIQETWDGVWMHLGVDSVMQATPARFRPGMGLRPGGERPDLEPLAVSLTQALYESVAAHSRLGLNVVVDIGHHDCYAESRGLLADCARRLAGLPVLFVGVRCPLPVILQRRRDTGWADVPAGTPAAPGPIELWHREVHIPGIYDLEVDTSLLSPQDCTAAIQKHLASGPAPTAFARLAESGNEMA